MNFTCSVARVDGCGRADAQWPDHTSVLREVGAPLHETRKQATRRLLEAVLKWAGAGLLLVSCALLIYLRTVVLARLSEGALFP
jgi:hypothetical protein